MAHGPNFAVTPPNPPILEYITSIELACQSLNTNEAEELRADIHRTIRHSHSLRLNLRKEEWKALKQLKTDQDCMVLTADKGVTLMVMDRQEYIKNARALLEDTCTYKPISTDPTTKLKNRLTNILKKMKTESEMDDNTYKNMYPAADQCTKVLQAPKNT